MKKSEVRDMIKEMVVAEAKALREANLESEKEEAIQLVLVDVFQLWAAQFDKFKYDGKDKLTFDFFKELDKKLGKDKALFSKRKKYIKLFDKMIQEYLVIVNRLVKSRGKDEGAIDLMKHFQLHTQEMGVRTIRRNLTLKRYK